MTGRKASGIDAEHPRPRAEVLQGLRDSVPIALGYFAVALAFGLYAARGEVPVWAAGLVSATNLSSSGQFAGIVVLLASGSLLQLALTVALVNLRYVLMALSLAQRLQPGVGVVKRLLLAHGITDEIYAVAMAREVIPATFYLAMIPLPVLGWTGGTVAGALVGQVLPASLQSAFGVLLYGMFIAIVVPAASGSRAITGVVLAASALGAALAWLPVTAALQPGWRIIIVTLVVAGAAAVLAPVRREAA